MPVPTIDPESGVLIFDQYQEFERSFAATNVPTSWSIASGSFPTGLVFQPSLDVTGTASTDIIAATAHGYAENTPVSFTILTGGSGLTVGTRYYVVNASADDFQLALTPGGAPINFTTNITAATLVKPGVLKGTPTVPGISEIRLSATNGTGTSAEVLFTIAIRPGAPSVDTNIDLAWLWPTNQIVPMTSSVLAPTSAAANTDPVITVKSGDDLFARLRILKGSTVLAPTMSALRLILKELDPELPIKIGSESLQEGTGQTTSYLVYMQLTAADVDASLSNYEKDAGTLYDGLAEFELTYDNPNSIGPSDVVRTSQTFRLRLVRELGVNV